MQARSVGGCKTSTTASKKQKILPLCNVILATSSADFSTILCVFDSEIPFFITRKQEWRAMPTLLKLTIKLTNKIIFSHFKSG